MAITGSGTAESPYIVTTADELKDAMETHHSTGDYLYVKLGNTIDLNFSGTFEKIQTSDSYDHIDLNLAGYSIQNIFLTDAMLELQKADVIHDGTILNVLTAPSFSAEYFISKGLFTNVSLSTFADVPTYTTFHSARFLRSAASMRYKIAQPIDDGTIFKAMVLRGADTTAESSMIEESDIKIVIDEFNAVNAELISQGTGNSNIKNSRISGEIKVYNNDDAQYYPKLSGITLVNSIVDFGVPDYSGSGSTPSASQYFCKGNTSYKSAVNTQILSSAYNTPIDNGCIECETSDMTNARSLFGKGFNCYQLPNIY